mmetsp:Transcript_73968/g.154173  ORF Transcript_73968/g.154173 Transcript_73968/m.154173 type:complete len:507 (+) Transcript_73968:140-1660(+)
MSSEPPSGDNTGGSEVVVDTIPRDTLVALIKRKDKEAKQAAAKLEKLEERYVKVVRFNKILMEDRSSFQQFCGSFLPETDCLFEEAAAQETTVNVESIKKKLATWRSSFESAAEDKTILRSFLGLVFPNDAEVKAMCEAERFNEDTMDTLQLRWMHLEDQYKESIASVNAMARQQMMEKENEVSSLKGKCSNLDKEIAQLKAQLAEFHREKAKTLTNRLQSGHSLATGAPEYINQSTPDESELKELKEALQASERREREARAEVQNEANRRQEELQSLREQKEGEIQKLKREMDGLWDEAEKYRAAARRAAEQKDTASDELRAKLAAMEEELHSTAFLSQMAEQQANRDAEVRTMQSQVDQVTKTLAEMQRLMDLSNTQEKLLKDRIRELESSHGRGHVAGDYLKHVVLKYMEYCQAGDMKAQGLVPVLCTLLHLTPEEKQAVEGTALPQSLLRINQAIGGASTWFRGSGASPVGGSAESPGQIFPAASPISSSAHSPEAATTAAP